MAITSQVSPSPQARQLFSEIVFHSDGEELCVEGVVALSVLRQQQGKSPTAQDEIEQLKSEGWISPAPGGGWLVNQ